MIIVGGTYLEECDWPEWNRLMGPGLRAALAVSELSKDTELYTYCHANNRADLDLTTSSFGITTTVRSWDDVIRFFYKHPLSSPPQIEPEASQTDSENQPNPEASPWEVTGAVVLAFLTQMIGIGSR